MYEAWYHQRFPRLIPHRYVHFTPRDHRKGLRRRYLQCPVAGAIIGVRNLKIITFGPCPQDFFACNAPIKGLYELGVEIEENSELELLVAYNSRANDPRIDEVGINIAVEMGEGRYYSDLLKRMAQFELTLLDWAEQHKGAGEYATEKPWA